MHDSCTHVCMKKRDCEKEPLVVTEVVWERAALFCDRTIKRRESVVWSWTAPCRLLKSNWFWSPAYRLILFIFNTIMFSRVSPTLRGPTRVEYCNLWGLWRRKLRFIIFFLWLCLGHRAPQGVVCSVFISTVIQVHSTLTWTVGVENYGWLRVIHYFLFVSMLCVRNAS